MLHSLVVGERYDAMSLSVCLSLSLSLSLCVCVCVWFGGLVTSRSAPVIPRLAHPSRRSVCRLTSRGTGSRTVSPESGRFSVDDGDV